MNPIHRLRRNIIVRKYVLKAISAFTVSALILPLFISPAKAYAAEETTPTVVFSTIEGEGVEIVLPDSIGKDAARTWYCNNEVLILDETLIDTSEGTTAKLKLTKTSTRFWRRLRPNRPRRLIRALRPRRHLRRQRLYMCLRHRR